MTQTNEMTNATLAGVTPNNFGGLDLKFKYPSPFSAETLVTGVISLFSRDKESTSQTERQLQTAFEDETIQFPYNDATGTVDPQPFTEWTQAHIGAPIKSITKSKNGHWALPFEGVDTYGNSNFKRKYKPEDGGTYNPDTQYVAFTDAVSESQRNEWVAKTGESITSYGNKGDKVMKINGFIDSAVLSSSGLNTDDIKMITRKNLIISLGGRLKKHLQENPTDTVVQGMQEQLTQLYNQINENPDSVGYVDIIKIFGGNNIGALNAKQTGIAAHDDLQMFLQKEIKQAQRITLTLYVRVPETNRTFTTSSMNSNYTNNQTPFRLEFLAGDFVQKDATEFMTFLYDATSFLDTVKEVEKQLETTMITETGAVVFDTPTKALALINAIIKHGDIEISADVLRTRQGKLSEIQPDKAARRIVSIEPGNKSAFDNSKAANADSFVGQETPTPTADNSVNGTASVPDPFGDNTAAATTKPSETVTPDPFGDNTATQATTPDPFGDNTAAQTTPDPFGTPDAADPFGGSSSNASTIADPFA